MDLRERVVGVCDRGEGTRVQIAKRFSVSPAKDSTFVATPTKETGSIAAHPQHPGRKPALNAARLHRVRHLVEQQPDATRRELKAGLGVSISDGALIRALRRLNLTLKKIIQSGRARPCGGKPAARRLVV